MAPLFDDPTDDMIESKNVRMRASRWRQLKAIAEVEGRSMNEVASYFLEWAVGDWSSLTTAEKIEAYKAALARIEARETSGPRGPMELPSRAAKAAPKRAAKPKK